MWELILDSPPQMSHGPRGSVGLFLLNAAEGWVDVKKNGQVAVKLKKKIGLILNSNGILKLALSI